MSRFKPLLPIAFILIFLTIPAFSVIKQQYGGNVKVAEDLTSTLREVRLFQKENDELRSAYGLPFQIQNEKLTVDLSQLPADRITEIEQATNLLQALDHPCHWILDYPHLGHEHHNRIRIDKNRLILYASEADSLPLIAESPCLIPAQIRFLMPFIRTQFGYEANRDCLAGRPFLDSISPVAIDPLNPYLAFKLNEVDAFLIPEEKFRQVVSDAQIQELPGSQYFVYLKTAGLSQSQVISILSALDLGEISRTVLNGHSEIYLEQRTGTGEMFAKPIRLTIPEESPFDLIGNRLRVQLESRGYKFVPETNPTSQATLELLIEKIQQAGDDAARYQVLKKQHKPTEGNWVEAWDELESAGGLVPLLRYQSRIALRKNLIGVQPGAGGMPDFSSAWIQPAP